MAKEKGEFAVTITNVSDGDDLLCSKNIDVSWEKPNATDVATVELKCSCGQHGPGGPMTFPTPTMGMSSGVRNFNLDHMLPRHEQGCTLTAVIKNGGGVEQKRDPRIVPVNCPLMPIGVKPPRTARATRAAAAGDPIEIDGPDDHMVHLTRGKNKRLTGKFKPAFGRKILVFVNKIQAGRSILLLVKEVSHKPVHRWYVNLPQVLWDGSDLLNVRLAFVDNKGILGPAFTFSTQVT